MKPDNRYFETPADEWILDIIIPAAFAVYNSFSPKVSEVLVKNLIFGLSFVGGCYMSGQLYLTLGEHMSESYYAVNSFTLDFAIYVAAITLLCCGVRMIINKLRIKKDSI